MKPFLIGIFALKATLAAAYAAEVYQVEAAVNDEKFIINGNLFEAKTYCFGWEEGDEVVFAEGSPTGICVSAILVNLRNGETCRVWCE